MTEGTVPEDPFVAFATRFTMPDERVTTVSADAIEFDPKVDRKRVVAKGPDRIIWDIDKVATVETKSLIDLSCRESDSIDQCAIARADNIGSVTISRPPCNEPIRRRYAALRCDMAAGRKAEKRNEK